MALSSPCFLFQVAFSLFFQGHSLVPGGQPTVHHYHNASESGSSMCGSSASSSGMESGSNSTNNSFGARMSYVS